MKDCLLLSNASMIWTVFARNEFSSDLRFEKNASVFHVDIYYLGYLWVQVVKMFDHNFFFIFKWAFYIDNMALYKKN